jgi:tRNA G46 methylase TrmB
MLKNEGTITITTDSAEYSAEIIDLFKEDPHFENLYKEQGYIPLDEDYGGSYFKRLWKELGRINRLMTFKKIGP